MDRNYMIYKMKGELSLATRRSTTNGITVELNYQLRKSNGLVRRSFQRGRLTSLDQEYHQRKVSTKPTIGQSRWFHYFSPKVKQTSNQEGLDQEGFVM